MTIYVVYFYKMGFKIFAIAALALAFIHSVRSIQSGLRKEEKSYWMFSGVAKPPKPLYRTNIVCGVITGVVSIISLVCLIMSFFCAG